VSAVFGGHRPPLQQESIKIRWRRTLIARLAVGALQFHGIGLVRAAHVAAEDEPFHVGRKHPVRFERVIVLAHVHQFFRMENAGLDEVVRVDVAGGFVGDEFGVEKIKPFSIRRVRDHVFVAAVAGKQRVVGRNIEMHAPFVPLQMIPGAFAGFDIAARDPEILAARRLQIIPDGFSVGAPEFVAGDFHHHRALVDEFQIRAVGADGPDAVELVPRAFVAEHEQVRVGRRKLQVAEPVRVGGADVCLAGREVVEKKRRRVMFGEAVFHHVAFFVPVNVLALDVRQVVRDGGRSFAVRLGVLGDRAGEQSFVRVDRRDGLAARERENFADGFRLRVGRADDAVGDAVFDFSLVVINLPGLAPDHDDADAPPDDFFDGVRLKIHHGNSIRRGDDHALAVGRERVQIEIKALAARLGRKLHDAVAGVGVNPFVRALRGGSRFASGQKKPEQQRRRKFRQARLENALEQMG